MATVRTKILRRCAALATTTTVLAFPVVAPNWTPTSALASAGHREPLVVAHRGGTADAPENTLPALREALRNSADMLWVTVQLTKDGVPVLYQPTDLSKLTNGTGKIADKTLDELRLLNAGWNFQAVGADGRPYHPYRAQPVPVPTVAEVLAEVPTDIPIVLDLKQLPADPLVAAVAREIGATEAWQRVHIYSTDAGTTELAARYPKMQVFESRDQTRQRLVDVNWGGKCSTPPQAQTWVGFELDRDIKVTETFTLGEGVSTTTARMWTPDAVDCFNTNGPANIVLFGVKTANDFQESCRLGVRAVLADSPKLMKTIGDCGAR